MSGPVGSRAAMRATLGYLCSLGLAACENIAPPVVDGAEVARNECKSNADCPDARCDEVLRMCVAKSAALSNLLIEIIPQSTDHLFGGFRFLRTLDDLEDTQASPLLLVPPPRVEGNITLAINSAAGCKANPRPVRISFVPLEQRLGLDTVRYSVTSVATFNDEKEQFEHTYSLPGLPLGTYDIYWEDAQISDDPPPPLCEVVPRLERAVAISRVDGRVPQLDLGSSPIRPLKVLVPWTFDLNGWTVDVIHPLTGERLSTRAPLSDERLVREPDSTEDVAIADLLLGQVVGPDYAETATQKGVLRLTPPTGGARPTIQVGLEGLELFKVGEARVPRLNAFDTSVRFQAWVWQEGAPDKPVAGSVTFDALTLTDVPQGVSARLTERVPIGADGQVTTHLPPGTYLARVHPDADLALSAFETTVEVFKPIAAEPGSPPSPSGEVQAGQVIAVPPGANLTGRVSLPTRSSSQGISVEAFGSRETDLRPQGDLSTSAPRTVVTLVSDKGGFKLAADCGRCDGESGVLFDLKVNPPAESGFPWTVVPDVAISEDADLGVLPVEFPWVYERTLEFAISTVAPEPRGFPNALIRAYVLVDRDNNVVRDSRISRCSELLKQPPAVDAPEPAQPCAERAVQVAEARSFGNDGRFRLFLPQTLVKPR